MTKKILIDRNVFLLLILCGIIGVSIIGTNVSSSLRYVKYLVPIFFSFLLIFKHGKANFFSIPLKNLFLFSALIFINLLYSLYTQNFSFRFIEESFLILLPILATLIVTSVIKLEIVKIIDYLFITYALIFFISNIEFFFDINFLSNFIQALKTSSFKTESWMAFPFGLFSLFYILEKRKTRATIAVILFLFAFKRISIAAIILGLCVYWFFYKKKAFNFNKSKALFWFIVLNISLLYILYNFIQGNYDVFIKDFTGLSPNHFTQGRLRIYTDSVNYFSDNMIFGNTLGSTNLYLTNNFEKIHFLHSDILKIIIEMGIFSYLIWVIYFFKINLVNSKSVPVLIFMNILFLSDNVFIYFDTLFIFYLLIIHYNRKNAESV